MNLHTQLTKKQLRELRERLRIEQRRKSFHAKLFRRIQSKLCKVNNGVCGGATEFERTKAVMRILVRAKLVQKML